MSSKIALNFLPILQLFKYHRLQRWGHFLSKFKKEFVIQRTISSLKRKFFGFALIPNWPTYYRTDSCTISPSAFLLFLRTVLSSGISSWGSARIWRICLIFKKRFCFLDYNFSFLNFDRKCSNLCNLWCLNIGNKLEAILEDNLQDNYSW